MRQYTVARDAGDMMSGIRVRASSMKIAAMEAVRLWITSKGQVAAARSKNPSAPWVDFNDGECAVVVLEVDGHPDLHYFTVEWDTTLVARVGA